MLGQYLEDLRKAERLAVFQLWEPRIQAVLSPCSLSSEQVFADVEHVHIAHCSKETLK